VNPSGIVRLANWIGTDLDASKYEGWSWEETIVPLINPDDHHPNSQKLFVDSLIARCCALDSKRSFASKPDFPKVITDNVLNVIPETLNEWPEHIVKDETSQKLLSKLVTVCPVSDMNSFIKEIEKESGLDHDAFMHIFADCVVKICSMSYLHCVGILNQQYENIAEIRSEVLLESVWKCCGKNTPVLSLMIDKMTTSGLVTLADVVNLLLVNGSGSGDDDDDSEMKSDETETKYRCIPWEVLDMVVEKCVVLHSTESLDIVCRAVSSTNEYSKRIQGEHPFDARLATSYCIHWQQLIA